MANEAVIVELPRNIHAIRRTVANSGTIEKLTCLSLDAVNTVTASAARDEWGGIAAAEKLTLDGSTSIAVHLDGVFDVKLGASTCTIGEALTLSGVNLFAPATSAEIQLGKFSGWAEEAGSADEVIRMRLRGS